MAAGLLALFFRRSNVIFFEHSRHSFCRVLVGVSPFTDYRAVLSMEEATLRRLVLGFVGLPLWASGVLFFRFWFLFVCFFIFYFLPFSSSSFYSSSLEPSRSFPSPPSSRCIPIAAMSLSAPSPLAIDWPKANG